jgi:hypothetical protein
MSKQWEYRVEWPRWGLLPDDLKAHLDEFGAEGWELCGFTDGDAYQVFKREVINE